MPALAAFAGKTKKKHRARRTALVNGLREAANLRAKPQAEHSVKTGAKAEHKAPQRKEKD